jgi:hypothetical protein
MHIVVMYFLIHMYQYTYLNLQFIPRVDNKYNRVLLALGSHQQLNADGKPHRHAKAANLDGVYPSSRVCQVCWVVLAHGGGGTGSSEWATPLTLFPPCARTTRAVTCVPKGRYTTVYGGCAGKSTEMSRIPNDTT